MTHNHFESGLATMKNFFPGKMAYMSNEYIDLLGDISQASTLNLVDRVRAEFQQMPTPKQLFALFQDLTYWDVPRFFDDWGKAYFLCCAEDYWFGFMWPLDPNFAPDPEHIRRRNEEEMYWLNHRSELRRTALNKGGKRAVQRELAEFADRGLLMNRTLTEYLQGENFRDCIQLGWSKPNIPDRMPKSQVMGLVRQVEASTARRFVQIRG